MCGPGVTAAPRAPYDTQGPSSEAQHPEKATVAGRLGWGSFEELPRPQCPHLLSGGGFSVTENNGSKHRPVQGGGQM